ncbi:MAG: hypothetical protein IJZ62_02390 [Clostridia bacterium]|nr:hypothetical protein [Clostridia bacterium]
MKIITLIIFGALCLGMDIVYTIFNKTKGYKAVLIKGLTIMASFILAVICTNFNSVTGALPIFIFIGLAFCLLSEAMSVSTVDEEKPKMIVFGLLKSVAIALFAVSALTLSGFNLFALGGGLLIGLGIGCIICAIKKYKKAYQLFSTVIVWTAVGFLLFEGVYACLTSVRFIASVMMVAAGVLIALSQLVQAFAKEGGKMQYVSSIMYTLALTVLALLIYFY